MKEIIPVFYKYFYPEVNVHNDSIMKKILIISLLFFIGLSLIFLALLSFNSSYFYGWIFSSCISLMGYLFGLYVIKITLKNKNKNFARIMTYIRIFILYILHIVAIIVLIYINKSQSNLSFWGSRGMHSLYEPINIFTYMGAILVIPISTLIAHLPSRKERS